MNSCILLTKLTNTETKVLLKCYQHFKPEALNFD